MKDELQTKLVEIITSIQVGIGKAGDFALEQLPDIAQQFITFGVISNVAYSLIQLTIAISFGLLACKLFKQKYELSQIVSVICGFCSLFNLFSFVIGLEETILVLFAPKVWLLMELAKLIK